MMEPRHGSNVSERMYREMTPLTSNPCRPLASGLPVKSLVDSEKTSCKPKTTLENYFSTANGKRFDTENEDRTLCRLDNQILVQRK